METKIFATILAVLFVICLGIGFALGYSNVFAPGAYSVPGQSMAQTTAGPTAQAGNTPVLR